MNRIRSNIIKKPGPVCPLPSVMTALLSWLGQIKLVSPFYGEGVVCWQGCRKQFQTYYFSNLFNLYKLFGSLLCVKKKNLLILYKNQFTRTVFQPLKNFHFNSFQTAKQALWMQEFCQRKQNRIQTSYQIETHQLIEYQCTNYRYT